MYLNDFVRAWWITWTRLAEVHAFEHTKEPTLQPLYYSYGDYLIIIFKIMLKGVSCAFTKTLLLHDTNTTKEHVRENPHEFLISNDMDIYLTKLSIMDNSDSTQVYFKQFRLHWHLAGELEAELNLVYMWLTLCKPKKYDDRVAEYLRRLSAYVPSCVWLGVIVTFTIAWVVWYNTWTRVAYVYVYHKPRNPT